MLLKLSNLRKKFNSGAFRVSSPCQILCDLVPFDDNEGIYIDNKFVFCNENIFDLILESKEETELLKATLVINNRDKISDSSYLTKIGISESRVGVVKLF